jgi:hypothetical protein
MKLYLLILCLIARIGIVAGTLFFACNMQECFAIPAPDSILVGGKVTSALFCYTAPGRWSICAWIGQTRLRARKEPFFFET